MYFKKAVSLILVCFVLALSLCGCSTTEQPAVSDVSSNSPSDLSPVMHVMNAQDMLDGQFSTIYTYGNAGFEESILWCECDITDVKLLPIEMDVETSDVYENGNAIFSLDSLKAGQAIKIDIYVPEIIPDTVVSYKVNGTEYIYAITCNLKDGGLSLMEVEFSERPASNETESEVEAEEAI